MAEEILEDKLSGWRRFIPIKALRNPAPLVSVIRLSGVIGGRSGPVGSGLTLNGFEKSIESAFSAKRVKAVALAINSPGGSPVQSALIARRIRALADEKNIPVIAFAEDVAASGGYWLACAADEIYADENSIVGSIGVVSAGFGFPALLEKAGIERRVHTAGDKKAILDPFAPENPDDITHLKELQSEIHQQFKDHVRANRGDRLGGASGADEDLLFSGAFWTGERAVEMGLVDGLGDLRTVMREKFGDKVRLPVMTEPKGWLQKKLGMSAVMTTAPSGWASGGWASGLIGALDERAHWSRFGL